MSWLSDTLDREQWAENPGTTAAKAVGCALLAPLCVGAHVLETSRELASEASEAVEAASERAERGLSGVIESAGGAASDTLRAAAQPLEQASKIAMWVAIAMYAVVAIIIVGAVVYFFR